MAFFDQEEFRTKIIALVKTMFPTLPIVKRFQNNTQPVAITDGKSMMDILIEKVISAGADYPCGKDENGILIWHGERLVQVSLELFAPNALCYLEKFRDMLETYSYREYMRANNFMDQRNISQPRESTRIHGETQYVESAVYLTRFHVGIDYIDGIGDVQFAIPDSVPDDEFKTLDSIDNGEINGNIAGNEITITY